MTDVALIAVAGAAAIVLVRVLASREATAFVLAFSVGTNASAVLAARHGVAPFLLPLSLLAVGAGALRFLAGPQRFRPPRTALPAAAFAAVTGVFLAAAIGPFVASDAAASARAVALLSEHFLVVAAMAVVCWQPTGMRAALYGFVAAGTALSAITNLQTALGRRSGSAGGFSEWNRELLGGTGDSLRAAGPFTDDPNAYALYLVVAIGVAAGLLLTRPSATSRWVVGAWWAAIASMVLAVAQTASRGGLLALGVTAVAALVLGGASARRVLLVGAVAAVLIVGPFGIGERLASLDATPTISARSSDADAGLRGRASEMLAAAEMFVDHPVTGVGYGTYNDRYLDYSRRIGIDPRHERRSAHSLPLEIAAEQGLIGIVAWAALAGVAIVVVRRLAAMRRELALPLGLALLAFATDALFLHDVHPRLMWSLVGMTVGAAAIVDRGHARDRIAALAAPDEPVRVGMVIQSYVPAIGGAERQLANLVPLLVARGIRPFVITRALSGRPRHDEVDGIPVERIPVRGPKPVRSLMFVLGARAALRRLDPHVVHAFDTLTPTSIALGQRRSTGAPIVTKILRSGVLGDLHRLAAKPFGWFRRRRVLDDVDVFVAISADIDDELAALGVPVDRRIQIPNGVDTDRFHPPTHRVHRIEDGPLTVIATGRLAPEKRLVELAERWNTVTARHPGTRLLIVGDGPEAARLAGYDGVELLGRRADVPDLLGEADIYVSASRAEGLSNSLLEAMATGLPSVVTDVGGTRDVIRTPNQGVVVDAADLDALVDELVDLIGDLTRRRLMRRMARRRVKPRFGIEATADGLATLYRRLASGTDDPSTDDDTGSTGPHPTTTATIDDPSAVQV